MSYKLGEIYAPKGVCRLGVIENVKDWDKLMNGVSQAGKFPEDARFQMSLDFPKDVRLADVLDNISSLLVVSERLKDFLEKEKALAHNDVFDVAIVNHKGRVEKAKYFIIAQIDLPWCVNASKTDGDKSRLDPDEYLVMRKLVLDEKKISRDRALFRPYEYKRLPMFRGDLAKKIEDGGFTGIEFFNVEEFDRF